MTQIAPSPAGLTPSAADAEAQRLDAATELTADDWRALLELEYSELEHLGLEQQLGLEAFVIDPNAQTTRNDTSTSPDGKNERPAIDPRALSDAYPPHSLERDFWEEVAVVSEQAALSPQSAVGTPHDHVARAIAVVAAHYSLPADKRVSPTGAPSSGGTQGRAEHASHPDKASGSDSAATELDFFDVLADLVGLEDVLGLPETRDGEGIGLSQTRQLAAMALVAHETNRNSALKAAAGRKG